MSEHNQKYIYKIDGASRPSNGKWVRTLFVLNGIPLIRHLPFIKFGICKAFGLHPTVSFNKGFYCSSPEIQVGENVGLADTLILAYAPVEIGAGCSFSYRNILITSTHDIENFSTVIAKPITIGKNVWITTNVIVLPGVTIGDGTIIGAGSVVTHDIPAGVLAAGNPCKVIKKINFNKT